MYVHIHTVHPLRGHWKISRHNQCRSIIRHNHMLNLFANACILNRCAWILLQDLRSNNVYCIPKHWEHISHCISLGPWKLSIFVWERTEQQNRSNPISTLDGVTSQHSFFTPLVVVFPVFEYLPHLSPLLALFVVLKAGQGKKSFEDAEKAKLLL